MVLGRTSGLAWWIGAWVWLIFAGLDPMLVQVTSPLNLLSPVYDHMFAVFLMTETLLYTGRSGGLRQLWSAMTVLLVVCLTVQPHLPAVAGALSATGVIGACSAASAWQLFPYGVELRLPATRLLSVAFLAPALAQAHHLYLHIAGQSMTAAIFSYLHTGFVVGMAQLLMLIEKSRRQEAVSRETLAVMAERAPVGLCLTGPGGQVSAMNSKAMELLGIDDAESLDLLSELSDAQLAGIHETPRIWQRGERACSARSAIRCRWLDMPEVSGFLRMACVACAVYTVLLEISPTYSTTVHGPPPICGACPNSRG